MERLTESITSLTYEIKEDYCGEDCQKLLDQLGELGKED